MAPRLIDPFHRRLHKDLVEEIEKCCSTVAAGEAASWDDYKHRVGYILGLQAALSHCEAVENQMYVEKKEE